MLQKKPAFSAVGFPFYPVYNACGLASYHLFDEVDFDKWFNGQLVHELSNSSSRYVSVKSPPSPLLLSMEELIMVKKPY